MDVFMTVEVTNNQNSLNALAGGPAGIVVAFSDHGTICKIFVVCKKWQLTEGALKYIQCIEQAYSPGTLRLFRELGISVGRLPAMDPDLCLRVYVDRDDPETTLFTPLSEIESNAYSLPSVVRVNPADVANHYLYEKHKNDEIGAADVIDLEAVSVDGKWNHDIAALEVVSEESDDELAEIAIKAAFDSADLNDVDPELRWINGIMRRELATATVGIRLFGDGVLSTRLLISGPDGRFDGQPRSQIIRERLCSTSTSALDHNEVVDIFRGRHSYWRIAQSNNADSEVGSEVSEAEIDEQWAAEVLDDELEDLPPVAPPEPAEEPVQPSSSLAQLAAFTIFAMDSLADLVLRF
jgi:hypothetical protein